MGLLSNLKNALSVLDSNGKEADKTTKREFNEFVFRHVAQHLIEKNVDGCNDLAIFELIKDHYPLYKKEFEMNHTLEFILHCNYRLFSNKFQPFNFKLWNFILSIKQDIKYDLIYGSNNNLRYIKDLEVIEFLFQIGLNAEDTFILFCTYFDLLPNEHKDTQTLKNLMDKVLSCFLIIDDYDNLLSRFFSLSLDLNNVQLCNYIVKDLEYAFSWNLNSNGQLNKINSFPNYSPTQVKIYTDLYSYAGKYNVPKLLHVDYEE